MLKLPNRILSLTFIGCMLVASQTYASCNDGIDNDHDGAVDSSDPDCNSGGLTESTRDFDGDGLWDGDETSSTTRVSVASDESQANASAISNDLRTISLSADGRFVAFQSRASNLVAGDTNDEDDIFVRDLREGITTRISVASGGAETDGDSYSTSISADGRYVAFVTGAAFDANDNNHTESVYVHDRQKNITKGVSINSNGQHSVRYSDQPSIGGDGRFVAFATSSWNLVSGDNNDSSDVFVHDRTTRQTTRVSVASDGTEGNSGSGSPNISADGRYVVFASSATNLVVGDTNNKSDVFVHDTVSGMTTRVNVASDGSQSQGSDFGKFPDISADGRFVVFRSTAANLVVGGNNGNDVFVHDRDTGATTQVSVASDGSFANSSSLEEPRISSDGRFVAFASEASNLVVGDNNGEPDVFVHDRATGKTIQMSLANDVSEANNRNDSPSISGDGHTVAFMSDASNLVAGDSNGFTDVFVRSGFGLNTDPADPDTDDDGLLDGFEVQHIFDPLIAGEQGLDPDTDGLTNLQEQTARTNPHESDSDHDGVDDNDEIIGGRNPAVNEGGINAIIKSMLLD